MVLLHETLYSDKVRLFCYGNELKFTYIRASAVANIFLGSLAFAINRRTLREGEGKGGRGGEEGIEGGEGRAKRRGKGKMGEAGELAPETQKPKSAYMLL
jgi:hypothetical protein